LLVFYHHEFKQVITNSVKRIKGAWAFGNQSADDHLLDEHPLKHSLQSHDEIGIAHD